MNFIQKFYLIGAGLFVVTIAANLWTLTTFWNTYFIGTKISQVCGVLFNLMLLIFFIYLYRTVPKDIKVTTPEDKEIEDLLVKCQEKPRAKIGYTN